MNSYIALETAAIFFLANLFLLGVCYGWFHLQWLTRPVNSENREVQNEKNSCIQWDSNRGPLASESNSLCVVLLVEISIKHINVDRVLPESCRDMISFKISGYSERVNRTWRMHFNRRKGVDECFANLFSPITALCQTVIIFNGMTLLWCFYILHVRICQLNVTWY